MSTPLVPLPAKLVVGVFMKEKSLLETVVEQLTAQFGALEMAGLWLPFDHTVYYESEMGKPLFRRFLVFEELVGQTDLARIKQITNAMEQRMVRNGKRQVNMDPGYLLQERLVLATGKNFTHRIYIGHGIYADLTLIYQKGAFQVLPWTYPDYATPAALQFLEEVRRRYREDLTRLSLLERKIYHDNGQVGTEPR
jgi:hypothetical protein